MSAAIEEPVTTNDLIAIIQRASPAVRSAAISELVRLHQELHDAPGDPMAVWNSEGLATALVVPFEKPVDLNAHTKEPGYEESIRREMEEVIRREGPPIRFD